MVGLFGRPPLLMMGKKKPFDGKKKYFFRRGYIDLRMHEEGYRLN
jgi:hypothetical protein